MYRSPHLVVLAVLITGCSRPGSAPAAHESPASVEHPRTEAELSTIKLTAEAVKRLGIETVTVSTDSAAATRTLGAEIVVPEGRSVVVTAPVAGTLTGAGPRAGVRVRRGDRLMTIAPLVPAERDQRIEAQRAVTAAEAEETAARQRLQRLEQLLKDGAASARSVEEARAQHQVSMAALTAARERLQGASRNPVGAQGELTVSAPFDGIVQRVSAVPGQTVAASAALLELAQVDTVWARVAVYAGDVAAVDEAQPAVVRRLGTSEPPVRATRVPAPLQGDPAAASVDLYYALSGASNGFRPGERVLAELPLRSAEKALVVPDTAVLYDIHGATWVYEDLGGNAYVRRRVEIARHAGNRAVVRRGIAEGKKVVTAGAAELFGTEFGAGH
jgi:membrane fusion protein, heavy metal efflux system